MSAKKRLDVRKIKDVDQDAVADDIEEQEKKKKNPFAGMKSTKTREQVQTDATNASENYQRKKQD